MAFDDRLLCLLGGLAVGIVIGYLVRLSQENRAIKEELDEVDHIVKDIQKHERNESGFMRKPWVVNLVAILLVGIAVYAAVASQEANNNMQASVDRNEIVTYCNLAVTSDALVALNERSTYTVSQTQANVDLQSDFADLINLLLHKPPYNEDIRIEAFQKYQTSLNNFVRLANNTVDKAEDNPFPEVDDLVDCINNGEVPGNGLQQYLDEQKNEGKQK